MHNILSFFFINICNAYSQSAGSSSCDARYYKYINGACKECWLQCAKKKLIKKCILEQAVQMRMRVDNNRTHFPSDEHIGVRPRMTNDMLWSWRVECMLKIQVFSLNRIYNPLKIIAQTGRNINILCYNINLIAMKLFFTSQNAFHRQVLAIIRNIILMTLCVVYTINIV